MPQTAVSGSGWNSLEAMQYQYRMAYTGDYTQPLNYDKHGYPVHTSNVRQMTYTGINTWNVDGYDYSASQPMNRRYVLDHQEHAFYINYSNNNPSPPLAATPIAISQYALSTGLIYVGGGQGNWGGLQTGQISQGGYNAY